jgi:hypothetical protein
VSFPSYIISPVPLYQRLYRFHLDPSFLTIFHFQLLFNVSFSLTVSLCLSLSLFFSQDTKLDVLNILANVAIGGKKCNAEVRTALQGVSEWFDGYMSQEGDTPQEPELNKAMVLLLARCWDYRLKTEDVLELTQANRKIALCTVVGLLEDGETYSTELRQRQKPGQGKMGQWEHELVCHR